MRNPILPVTMALVAFAAFGQDSQGKPQQPPPAANPAVTPQTTQPAVTPPPQLPAQGAAALPKGTPQAPKPNSEITQDYTIGAEDVISILVYGEPSFNVLGQTVRPDGFVSMPLVGELKAMGKRPSDMETEIAQTLADKFLRYTPKVEVRVDQVKSRYYSINGGVNKPGQYPLLVPTTIMQALVNAGGFHEFADLKRIKLLRDGKLILTFNWYDAVKGKHPESNIYLKHGDLIIVKD
jgi:polysaccharide export outer membrane protein